MTLNEYYDFPNELKVSFKYVNYLDSVEITPPLTNFDFFFYNEKRKCIKFIDTSQATSGRYMFSGCSNLISLPPIDTSKMTNFYLMLSGTDNLRKLPPLDCSLNDSSDYPIQYYSEQPNLTDIGGFIGMKKSWDNNYGLSKLPNLTYQSCINVLNGLYDFTTNGETPKSDEGKLKVHQNFIDKLTEEDLQIAIGKNWVITT